MPAEPTAPEAPVASLTPVTPAPVMSTPATSAGRAPGALDLAPPRQVHVVGVGGVGMSAIATVLAGMGHRVSGSDVKASPVTERLRALGIGVSIGHDPEQVAGADLVTYSPAVPEDNIELAEARRRGIAVVRRSAVLAAIAATRRCVAVAGTHGKTTTASMLSLILVEAGLRPSYLIGADVNETGTNALWDTGEWLVMEADESYGSFGSLRSDIALVTNVEPDHLDHYGTFDSLADAFVHYLTSSGRRVVSADDPVAARLGAQAGAATVGTSPDATYRIGRIVAGRSAIGFDLHGPAGRLGRIELPVPGAHNARNAALAVVGAIEVGAPFEAATSALARFAGVPRRFEFRGEAGGITFVDDYAHLPTEVRATLAAAKAGEWRRIVAVFQPHRYTRTAALAESFATAFDDADLIFITDVYSAGETPVPGVSGRLVADAVSRRGGGHPVVYVSTRDELRAAVAAMLQPGDLCVTLGAGDLTTLPEELMALRSEVDG
ncbi:MAG TPA: UDP-N-acetylmuramate--L-alanine ligase [Acidimicrobiales bacterium]|nr:UDP-N-acetylmuramate--L-alanine ligase [Acidimicrobiales bacterium]